MKDLDFDELDKAVNSLMASDETATADKTSPVVTAAADPPASDSAPVSSAVDSVPQTEPSAPTVESTPTPELQTDATTPAAAAQVVQPKRSGRFMDVFHPSSDMKSGPAPARPRQEVSLTPLTAAATTSADTAPTESPESAAEPVAPASVAWPDPLDMAEKSAEPVSNESAEPVSDSIVADDTLTSQMAELEKTLASDSTKTASSVDQATPFLADAKVEKRPLGGQATDALLSVDEPRATTAETATEQDVPSTEPVPAELDKDILAVESGGEHSNSPADPEVENSTAVSDPNIAPAAAAATLPSSITQQYKQQESSGDQSHAGLYDTAPQDASLQHPAKKKSGWMIVLWIVLLIAVGVGGAAALYYMNFI